MHELSIARRIVEVIEDEAEKNGIARVSRAKIKIGKMAASQREQLEFCLSSYEKNAALEGMKFEIEETPVSISCNACGRIFGDGRFDDEEYAHHIAHAPALYIPPGCPACQSQDVSIISGREMELGSIEGE